MLVESSPQLVYKHTRTHSHSHSQKDTILYPADLYRVFKPFLIVADWSFFGAL